MQSRRAGLVHCSSFTPSRYAPLCCNPSFEDRRNNMQMYVETNTEPNKLPLSCRWFCVLREFQIAAYVGQYMLLTRKDPAAGFLIVCEAAMGVWLVSNHPVDKDTL